MAARRREDAPLEVDGICAGSPTTSKLAAAVAADQDAVAVEPGERGGDREPGPAGDDRRTVGVETRGASRVVAAGSEDDTPANPRGRRWATGYIERSLVYLRDLDPVRRHYADMQRVKEHVRLQRYNETIRSFLAAHDDPPISDDERVARPWWGPLAAPD
jgi:hypothetical protein